MARRTKAQIMEGVDCVWSRIVENNTVEYGTKEGDKVVRLHLTDIVTFKGNGDIILNSDGWRTVTTKDRMNKLLDGWHVWQESGVWYVERGQNWDRTKSFVYADGMILHSNGTTTGAGEDVKAILKTQKRIKKYCKEYMEALFEGKVPAPSMGDCWSCSLHTVHGNGDEETMGEVFKDTSHLESHFNEKYYVPSLLSRAIEVEVFPVSHVARHVLGYFWKAHEQEAEMWHDIAREQLSKSLKRYLYRQFGVAT